MAYGIRKITGTSTHTKYFTYHAHLLVVENDFLGHNLLLCRLFERREKKRVLFVMKICSVRRSTSSMLRLLYLLKQDSS